MQLRGLTLFLALCLWAGCGGAAGKIMADTKVPTKEDPNAVLIPYEPPDFAALTGIPDEEEDKDEGGEPATPPAPPAAPAPESKQ
ncbi:MAG TPA: hypothetical protein VN253_20585 [Kofleriaceae bacterium]|nr:hypothetical protein [Kofleriaceae bacterium]